jgi:hypothetical protein
VQLCLCIVLVFQVQPRYSHLPTTVYYVQPRYSHLPTTVYYACVNTPAIQPLANNCILCLSEYTRDTATCQQLYTMLVQVHPRYSHLLTTVYYACPSTPAIQPLANNCILCLSKYTRDTATCQQLYTMLVQVQPRYSHLPATVYYACPSTAAIQPLANNCILLFMLPFTATLGHSLLDCCLTEPTVRYAACNGTLGTLRPIL